MGSIKIFLVSFSVLLSGLGVFGRELQCSYSTESWELWPLYHRCVLNSVDLSETFKLTSYTFSGNYTKKCQATVVEFHSGPSPIDFIPKEALTAFPNLNGLVFNGFNSPVLKNNLFSEDFKDIEYLYLYGNQIHMIELVAFGHLNKLKWVRLDQNQIQSLPFQLFKTNPDLIFISFSSNKIASINPNFFAGLNKLKIVDLEGNQCINKEFGCSTCSVSQSTLNSELSSCFQKCHSDSTCFQENFLKSSITSLNESIISAKEDLLGHLTAKTLEIQTSLSNKKTLDSEFNTLSTNLVTQTQSNFQKTKELLTGMEKKLKENSEMFKEEIGKQSLSFGGMSTSIKNDFELAIANAIKNMSATLKDVTKKTEAILNETKSAVSGFVEKLNTKVEEVQRAKLKSNLEVTEFNKKTFEEATKYMEKLHQQNIDTVKEMILEKTDNELEHHLLKTDVKRVDQSIRMLTSRLSEVRLQLEVEKLKAVIRELNFEKDIDATNAKVTVLEKDNETLKGENTELQKQQLDVIKRLEALEGKFNSPV